MKEDLAFEIVYLYTIKGQALKWISISEPFCILQYIEKKQILLHMPFVKCLKVLKIFIRAFSFAKISCGKARYREMR